MNRRRGRARDLRQAVGSVDREALHQWWRRIFGASLILVLVAGLYLSFRPAGFEDAPPDLASDDATQEPAEGDDAPAPEAPTDDEGEVEEEAAEDEEEEPALTEEEIRELIDNAREPSATSVQVLDAGGGSSATSDVADVLSELGYDVVAINPSRVDYDVTTVLFTSGNEAEADALRARDDRFTSTAPNERLSEGVDLHVVVGSDWTG
jgi:hypothetical protein